MFRCIALAVIVFFGFLTLVQAQPAPQNPDSRSEVINGVGERREHIGTGCDHERDPSWLEFYPRG
jgi:hypothetical protein